MAGKRRSAGERWSARREDAFFAMLADSCNVTRSAAAAGVSASAAYRRRRKEAGFRGRWGEALATGYAQLELEMLERALKGKDKAVIVAGESRIIKEYDDRIALALLKMHRDTVDEIERGVDGQEHEEAVERILARLQRMRAQLTGECEVKRGIDRIALLAQVLKLRKAMR